MLFNLQLLVKKRMSGDERINAPPVCIFQIIVALYQSRTPLGRNDVGIDTEQQKVCIAGERINSGEFVNWLNELVFFLCLQYREWNKF